MLISSNIIDRIIGHKGFKTDVELSEYWEVSATSVANWRTRNSIPFKKIITFCEEEGISLDYIFSGEGKKYLTEKAKTPPIYKEGSTDNAVEELHIDLVKNFKDKGRACRINKNLLEIEDLSPEIFEKVDKYISDTTDTVKIVVGAKALDLEESTPKKKKA
jgi:hypothetical protein